MPHRLFGPLRSLLFRLDPEQAHDTALRLSAMPGASALIRLIAGRPVQDPVTLMGLDFPNRIGLAAGLDKNGRHIDALADLGFGFLEVGTVTPQPQPGNPKPRMFRLPDQRAIINRFGFNNDGLETFLENVKTAQYRGVLGLNIGKNASTPDDQAIGDYILGLRACYPHASYIAVNVSSPNTSNLRALQHDKALSAMLLALSQERADLKNTGASHVPIVLKIAPDLTADQIDEIAGRLVEHGFDGVIATNTTISRKGLEHAVHGQETGGLSGAPLQVQSTAVIAQLRTTLPDGFPIIGVGGIQHEQDAREKLQAGADLMQLYSGLIYEGPALVQRCANVAKAYFNAQRETLPSGSQLGDKP